MPITIPKEENPDVTIKVLASYYDSLENLLDKYEDT